LFVVWRPRLGDTHADGHPDRFIFFGQKGSLVDHLAQPFSQEQRLRTGRIRKHRDEFLAPIAREHVIAAQDRTGNPAYVLEDLVTRGVPVAVIDPLEPVAVKNHEAKGTGGPLYAFEFPRQSFVKKSR